MNQEEFVSLFLDRMALHLARTGRISRTREQVKWWPDNFPWTLKTEYFSVEAVLGSMWKDHLQVKFVDGGHSFSNSFKGIFQDSFSEEFLEEAITFGIEKMSELKDTVGNFKDTVGNFKFMEIDAGLYLVSKWIDRWDGYVLRILLERYPMHRECIMKISRMAGREEEVSRVLRNIQARSVICGA